MRAQGLWGARVQGIETERHEALHPGCEASCPGKVSIVLIVEDLIICDLTFKEVTSCSTVCKGVRV